MTKCMMHVKENGEIFFDCSQHSGDHDVCTMVTAYCNVLVAECRKYQIEPEIYQEDGHVRINILNANDRIKEVFDAVRIMLEETSKIYPEHLKIY